jgi:hypothetical protein
MGPLCFALMPSGMPPITVSFQAKTAPTTVSSNHSYVAPATYRDVHETWSAVWLPTAEHKMSIPTTPIKRDEKIGGV